MTGEVETALECIEASHRLAGSLRGSPQILSQLILIHATRLQTGVLRHVPDLPAGWVERMEAYDHREALLAAFEYDGWIWLDVSAFRSESRSSLSRLAAVVSDPYHRICAADVSDAWRKRMEAATAIDAPCDRRLPSDHEGLPIELASWNRVDQGVTGVKHLQGAVDRVARLELDLELTRLVRQADAARRELADPGPGDAWVPPATRPSAVCPDDHWGYTADDNGGLRIELSREIDWPEQRGTILPTRVVF